MKLGSKKEKELGNIDIVILDYNGTFTLHEFGMSFLEVY